MQVKRCGLLLYIWQNMEWIELQLNNNENLRGNIY